MASITPDEFRSAVANGLTAMDPASRSADYAVGAADSIDASGAADAASGAVDAAAGAVAGAANSIDASGAADAAYGAAGIPVMPVLMPITMIGAPVRIKPHGNKVCRPELNADLGCSDYAEPRINPRLLLELTHEPKTTNQPAK